MLVKEIGLLVSSFPNTGGTAVSRHTLSVRSPGSAFRDSDSEKCPHQDWQKKSLKELVNKITLNLDICQASKLGHIKDTELYAEKIMLGALPIKLLLQFLT